MTWTVRHAGSPQWVSGLSRDVVLEGLADGQWETTDEVCDDTGGAWQPLEQHPEFAAAAAEVEPVRHEPEDESRLDMNPLIDVSLVLLIFFIITTTYETIRKVLDMPGVNATARSAAASAGIDRIKDLVIRIDVRLENGRPRVRVDGQEVALSELSASLGRLVAATKKRQVLLDAQGVEWGVVVEIMDAARAAGVEKTLLATRSTG